MHKCNSVITDAKIQKIMKTKEEIVANWLPRYTKRSLNDFGEYILLTNFNKYVELFADKFNVPKESLLLILAWEVLMLPSLWIC